MSEQPKSIEKKKGYFQLGKHWPFVIVGMLVFHASLMVGTIMVVSARNDLYVDKDYYAKLVDWDHQREMMEAADKLGWDVELVAIPKETSPAYQMQITMIDQDGQPMDGALIELEWFHPAHANERSFLVFAEQGEGQYKASVDAVNPGFWRAELAIRYQGTQAMVSREIEIQ